MIFLFLPPFAYTFTYGSRLIDAVDKGDISTVRGIVNSGYSVNSKGDFGTTALIRATIRGNVAMVNYLLNRGANPDIQDIGGASAVHIASRQGNLRILELLIQRSSLNDLHDVEGYTPAMRAAKSGKSKSLNILIENGADVDKINSKEDSLASLIKQSKNEKVKKVMIPALKTTDKPVRRLLNNPIDSDKKITRKPFNLKNKINELDKHYDNILGQKHAVNRGSTIEVTEAIILTDDFDFKTKDSSVSVKHSEFHVIIKGFRSDEELGTFWLKLNTLKSFEGLKVELIDKLTLKISYIQSENMMSNTCKSVLLVSSHLICSFS